MMMESGNAFLFLGTGASMGIPVVGCHCRVCTSQDLHNRRLRAAGVLFWEGSSLLVDAGPDLRLQALSYGLRDIDGVVITHAHYDHIGGMDDLRPLAHRKTSPLPLLLSIPTWAHLTSCFQYLFQPTAPFRFAVQLLDGERGEVNFQGVPLRYFTYMQMGTAVNGFRIGDTAYVSDIRDYPETLFEDLQGIRTLVVSALRFTPSPMHFSLDEALAFAERCGAAQTWLTHIAHDLDHVQTESYLPPNVRLAYDGLRIAL